MKASPLRPTMAARRGCSCRIFISGNRRSGSTACSSPTRTRRASGNCAATTPMAIPGASSAIRMTEALAPDLASHRPARWQPATITAISRLTPRVASFRFLPGELFTYRAGQHVDVRLTAPDGYTAQRSYSIASAPESGDEVELVIEKLEDGEVS